VRKPVYVRPLSRQGDPDYVAACADSMRRAFNRLYGGNWIVVRRIAVRETVVGQFGAAGCDASSKL